MTHPLFSRRRALKTSACGFGYLALAGLANQQAAADAPGADQTPLAPKPPHFRPRAKRVIFLYMMGGPPQTDTFDYKPLLFRDDLPDNLLRPPCTFAPCGKSGIPVSSLFPHTREFIDDLCVINSVCTDIPNHP